MDKISYKLENGNYIKAPVFEGILYFRIPKIFTQNYTPISIAEIMKQRVNALQSRNKKLINEWCNNYFDSFDRIIYHPKGKILIIPNSKKLRKSNLNTYLEWNNSLKLEDGTFDKIKHLGYEFSKTEVEKYANKYLEQNEAIKNPILLSLVQNDKELLKEYVNFLYKELNEYKLMKIKISKEIPKFEVKNILSTNDIFITSIVYEYPKILFCERGRLVGIPNEIENLDNLNQKKKSNLESLVKDII